MTPQELLAERFKPYRQAEERYQRAAASHVGAQQRVVELESELAAAESRDRVTRGDALVDGRRPGRSEADNIRPRLEEAKRDAEDLAYAAERAAQTLDNLPRERKGEWLRSAQRDFETARSEYVQRLGQLAEARERLAREAALFSYLRGSPIHLPSSLRVHASSVEGLSSEVVFGDVLTALRDEVVDLEFAALRQHAGKQA